MNFHHFEDDSSKTKRANVVFDFLAEEGYRPAFRDEFGESNDIAIFFEGAKQNVHLDEDGEFYSIVESWSLPSGDINEQRAVAMRIAAKLKCVSVAIVEDSDSVHFQSEGFFSGAEEFIKFAPRMIRAVNCARHNFFDALEN